MMKLLLLQLCDSLPATTTMLPSCTVCLSWHLHYLLHFANSSSSGSMISKPSGTLIWINGIKTFWHAHLDQWYQNLLARSSGSMVSKPSGTLIWINDIKTFWHAHLDQWYQNLLARSSGSMVSKPSGTLIWINGIKTFWHAHLDQWYQNLLARSSGSMVSKPSGTLIWINDIKTFWHAHLDQWYQNLLACSSGSMVSKNLLRGWEGVKTHTNSSGKKIYYVDGKESRHIQTLLAKKSSGTNKFL